MAYRGYKVVAFTPAGRKRQMSVLLDNLSRFTDVLDEYQVWFNTDVEEQAEDSKWLRSLPKIYDWVKLVELPEDFERLQPKQMNTGLFYMDNTVEEDTIYIRFDDDIVYIDDEFFVNMLDFRIDNPDYFLVMANIWNNAVLSWIHQYLKHVPSDEFVVEEPYCMDPVGWRSGPFAKMIHELLFDRIQERATDKLFFDRADLHDATRFSISCFAFFGKDFAKFDGVVGQPDERWKVKWDEEIWLTEVYPIDNKLVNTICGSALVSHYSFFDQRPFLDQHGILDQYREIAKQKLSAGYYDQLETANKKEYGKKKKVKSSAKKRKLKTVVLPENRHRSPTAEALAVKAEEDSRFAVVQDKTKVKIFRDGVLVGQRHGKLSPSHRERFIKKIKDKYS